MKLASSELLVKAMARMVPKLSMKNLSKILRLADLLLREEKYRPILKSFETYVAHEHPATKLIEKVLYELAPNVRFRIIYNLFILGLLYGTQKRDEILKKEGFRPPLFFVISPTMRCNMRCYGCYSGEYEKDFGLPYDVIDRILTEAEKMHIHFVTISGGEPFLREDLLELYEKHRDIMFQVYTNGTLITEDLAKRLSELGNVAPMVSIEGFEERTDSRRGKGHFKLLMEVFDRLKRHGVLFGASIMQTRENYLEISSHEFIKMLVEKGVSVIWYFQYIPVGHNPDPTLMLLPEERDEIRRRLRVIRNTYPIFLCDFWNDGAYIEGCLAGGREYFHINANGDVEPCVFVHFAVDNIKDKTLKEVLLSPFFKGIRANQPFSDNPLTPCMIIDNPKALRELVRKYNASPTHPGAESIVNELSQFLDDYAKKYRAIAQKTWNEEYGP
ncbi:MAG: radical SAM protein [Desulfobacterota bacterium]|nr:radical SAM protein [Thermodesulfobacteriota bacterium]MDW8002502.1 radical SAM protein [Deltaproteobacteria bacterium]